MKPVLTPEQAAELDRETQARGTPAELLMERAGRAVARAAVDLTGGVYGRRCVVVCGKGNNGGDGLVAARYLARWGMRVAVATPPELQPREEIALAAGDAVELLSDPVAAARGARALYTDVWVSMGDEDEAKARRKVLAPYQLNEQLLAVAADDAVVLHCLPAHPGEEITSELLYGDRSAVWDQAENRLHAQKALLELLIAP